MVHRSFLQELNINIESELDFLDSSYNNGIRPLYLSLDI